MARPAPTPPPRNDFPDDGQPFPDNLFPEDRSSAERPAVDVDPPRREPRTARPKQAAVKQVAGGADEADMRLAPAKPDLDDAIGRRKSDARAGAKPATPDPATGPGCPRRRRFTRHA